MDGGVGQVSVSPVGENENEVAPFLKKVLRTGVVPSISTVVYWGGREVRGVGVHRKHFSLIKRGTDAPSTVRKAEHATRPKSTHIRSAARAAADLTLPANQATEPDGLLGNRKGAAKTRPNSRCGNKRCGQLLALRAQLPDEGVEAGLAEEGCAPQPPSRCLKACGVREVALPSTKIEHTTRERAKAALRALNGSAKKAGVRATVAEARDIANQVESVNTGDQSEEGKLKAFHGLARTMRLASYLVVFKRLVIRIPYKTRCPNTCVKNLDTPIVVASPTKDFHEHISGVSQARKADARMDFDTPSGPKDYARCVKNSTRRQALFLAATSANNTCSRLKNASTAGTPNLLDSNYVPAAIPTLALLLQACIKDGRSLHGSKTEQEQPSSSTKVARHGAGGFSSHGYRHFAIAISNFKAVLYVASGVCNLPVNNAETRGALQG